MPQITIHHNPFELYKNVEYFTPRADISLREWLDEEGISEFARPTICLIGGEPVLRERWADMETR